MDASAPDASEPSDASAPDASTPAPKIKAPSEAAGDPSRIAGKDPNVEVLLAGDKLRGHELGAAFGKLLVTLPEWAMFFEGTPIDPVKDFDHVLFAGPQMRNDFRKVVAVMDYNIPEKKVREAMGILVERANGTWIKESPVPAASITIARDKGERILALVPNRRLLVLLPKDLEPQLSTLKNLKPFAKSGAAIVVKLVSPARALRELPLSLPDTLKQLRISITPRPNGEADVDLEAIDSSANDAVKHAKDLTQQLESVRRIDLLLKTVELFEKTDLVADGVVIRGRTHMDRKQVQRMITFAEGRYLKPAKPTP
jgi:hypothetical protein